MLPSRSPRRLPSPSSTVSIEHELREVRNRQPLPRCAERISKAFVVANCANTRAPRNREPSDLAVNAGRCAESVSVVNVYGFAARFGIESKDLGFREIIADDALSEADMTDVVGLFNHDPSAILGRSTAGTLEVGVTKMVGLRYNVQLPQSPIGENVAEAVRRRDVSEASFAFEVEQDEWDVDESRDVVVRRILKIAKVFDVSPVTEAAYPETSARLRE